jgi:beta-glucosidase
MKKILLSLFLAGLGIIISAQKSIDQKVTELMAKMTLEEKIGQLNQYNDDITATGPVTKDADKAGQVRAGKLGSILNAVGVKTLEIGKTKPCNLVLKFLYFSGKM